MPPKLKTVHEIEDEISDAKDELGESENDEESESGDEIDDVSKQVWLSKRIKRFVTRFFKGFGSGLGVYSGIKIVTALMRNPFRERYVPISAKRYEKHSGTNNIISTLPQRRSTSLQCHDKPKFLGEWIHFSEDVIQSLPNLAPKL